MDTLGGYSNDKNIQNRDDLNKLDPFFIIITFIWKMDKISVSIRDISITKKLLDR